MPAHLCSARITVVANDGLQEKWWISNSPSAPWGLDYCSCKWRNRGKTDGFQMFPHYCGVRNIVVAIGELKEKMAD